MSQDVCTLLEWDSAFWGVRVGRVLPTRLNAEEMAAALRWCAAQQVQWLYLLADAAHTPTVRLAEDHHFRLVDIRTLFALPLKGAKIPAPSATVRPVRPEDMATLREIARQSFRDGRFYHDPRVSPAKADAFYETWIVNSAEGFADAVLVAELEGAVGGMITCHLKDTVGSIGLVGVHHAMRGRGLGRALTWAAVRFFAEHGMHAAHVVTQGRNIPAQRLYQACGFKTQSVHLWYHRWFDLEGKHGSC